MPARTRDHGTTTPGRTEAGGAAGPSADGWMIIAVHESQDSWERFRDEKLMPTMSAGIDGGFPTPPQESGFTVHNQQTG